MFIEFTSHLKPEILVELYNNDVMGLLMVVNGPFYKIFKEARNNEIIKWYNTLLFSFLLQNEVSALNTTNSKTFRFPQGLILAPWWQLFSHNQRNMSFFKEKRRKIEIYFV